MRSADHQVGAIQAGGNAGEHEQGRAPGRYSTFGPEGREPVVALQKGEVAFVGSARRAKAPPLIQEEHRREAALAQAVRLVIDDRGDPQGMNEYDKARCEGGRSVLKLSHPMLSLTLDWEGTRRSTAAANWTECQTARWISRTRVIVI